MKDLLSKEWKPIEIYDGWKIVTDDLDEIVKGIDYGSDGGERMAKFLAASPEMHQALETIYYLWRGRKEADSPLFQQIKSTLHKAGILKIEYTVFSPPPVGFRIIVESNYKSTQVYYGKNDKEAEKICKKIKADHDMHINTEMSPIQYKRQNWGNKTYNWSSDEKTPGSTIKVTIEKI